MIIICPQCQSELTTDVIELVEMEQGEMKITEVPGVTCFHCEYDIPIIDCGKLEIKVE